MRHDIFDVAPENGKFILYIHYGDTKDSVLFYVVNGIGICIMDFSPDENNPDNEPIPPGVRYSTDILLGGSDKSVVLNPTPELMKLKVRCLGNDV